MTVSPGLPNLRFSVEFAQWEASLGGGKAGEDSSQSIDASISFSHPDLVFLHLSPHRPLRPSPGSCDESLPLALQVFPQLLVPEHAPS